MDKRRVVVTGMGTVNPLGLNVDETWNHALAGKSGVGPLTRVDVDQFPIHVSAEVDNFDPSVFIDKRKHVKWIALRNLL